MGIKNSFSVTAAPALRRLPFAPWIRGNRTPALCIEAEEYTGLSKLAFAALWLLVFAIPWEDAITITDFGTGARLVGLATAGLAVLAAIDRGKLRELALGHFLMAMFVTLAALSYLWSLDPEQTLVQVFTYIQLLAMVWLIWELAADSRKQLKLMQAYIFGTFVSGVGTVWLYLAHRESDYQRYAGAGLNANDLGLMMALSIPISYSLLIQTHGKMVWVYKAQLVLAVVTIVLTASRGAALASVVALAIVPATHARLTPHRKIALLMTGVLLVSGGILFVPASSWQRLSTVPTEFAQGTLTGRTLIWTAGWQLFLEHPFLGVGANAFRPAVSRVLAEPIRLESSSPAPPAHNTFLSVLVEQGVIGFAIFCALLGSLAFAVEAMPEPWRRLWIVCLAVWVVGVSSLTWEMRKPTWYFFGLLIAQAAALAKNGWVSKRRTAFSRIRLSGRSSLNTGPSLPATN